MEPRSVLDASWQQKWSASTEGLTGGGAKDAWRGWTIPYGSWASKHAGEQAVPWPCRGRPAPLPDVVTAQECREDCPPAACLLALPEHEHCPPRTRVRAADSLELTPQAPGSREGLPEDTVKVNALLWAGICGSPEALCVANKRERGPCFSGKGRRVADDQRVFKQGNGSGASSRISFHF